MLKDIVRFFDKLEDSVRIALSRRPIVYAFIGAVGIILLWKGVWETAGLVPVLFGPGSIVVGAVILLLTGLLVSFFIHEEVFLSGRRKEEKLFEKMEAEVRSEQETLADIAADTAAMREKLEQGER